MPIPLVTDLPEAQEWGDRELLTRVYRSGESATAVTPPPSARAALNGRGGSRREQQLEITSMLTRGHGQLEMSDNPIVKDALRRLQEGATKLDLYCALISHPPPLCQPRGPWESRACASGIRLIPTSRFAARRE